MLPVRADLSAEEVDELAAPLPQWEPLDNENVLQTSFRGQIVLEIIRVIRDLNFKHNYEKAVEVYEDLYKDALRHAKQFRLTDFFKLSRLFIQILYLFINYICILFIRIEKKIILP